LFAAPQEPTPQQRLDAFLERWQFMTELCDADCALRAEPDSQCP
jgi:hypothetical protein